MPRAPRLVSGASVTPSSAKSNLAEMPECPSAAVPGHTARPAGDTAITAPLSSPNADRAPRITSAPPATQRTAPQHPAPDQLPLGQHPTADDSVRQPRRQTAAQQITSDHPFHDQHSTDHHTAPPAAHRTVATHTVPTTRSRAHLLPITALTAPRPSGRAPLTTRHASDAASRRRHATALPAPSPA